MSKIDELWSSACSNYWNDCIITKTNTINDCITAGTTAINKAFSDIVSAANVASSSIFYNDYPATKSEKPKSLIQSVDYEKINKEKENKKMKVVTVKFLGSAREYDYLTSLDLKVGAKYKATADGSYTYDTPVIVVRYAQKSSYNGKLRTLTKMELIDKEKNPTKIRLKKLVFNKKKKTTAVLWSDGTATKVKLMDGEEWNEEYAFAACILKKFFGDRGYSKRDFRRFIAAAERIEDVNVVG